MSKKIINVPQNFVSEATAGFLAAFGGQYEQIGDTNALKVRQPQEKVALVIGGGSGHEPMFGYFIGDGLADASPNGNIFASPDPYTIFQAAMAVQTGKRVLFVYGNYAGDNMDFDIAGELLDEIGIPHKAVRVWDDIASAPANRIEDRRGIAGDLFVIKIAGAVTKAGATLDEAFRVTQKARDNTWSIGVGLSGTTIPGEANPIFRLGRDEMEFGLGIHGEPGIGRVKLQPGDTIVTELTHLLLTESGIQAGDEICTYVNGLGSTTLLELFCMNRKLAELLQEKNIKVHDMEVNSYVTSQEMAGASITLFRVDDELKSYYDLPCYSPYYKKLRGVLRYENCNWL